MRAALVLSLAALAAAGCAEKAAPTAEAPASPSPAASEAPPAAAAPSESPEPAAAAPEAPPPAPGPAGDVSPSLTIETPRVAPGAEVRVAFTAPPHWPRNAWIGIVPPAVPHGNEAENDDHDLTYRYLDGATAGTVVFEAPRTPGPWEVRMFDADDGGREVGSAAFEVSGAP